jgi:hypothetical protein
VKEVFMTKRTLVIGSLFFVFPITLLMGQRRTYESVEETFRVTSDRSLEVLLHVDAGEVYVQKGTDARSGTISIKYTRGEFREKIDFSESKNRLKISLKKDNWYKLKKTRYGDDDVWAEVSLELPYGVDILFDSKVKAGEVTMSMGGLRLQEFSMNNWAGEVEVRFDEPNRIPMEFLDIDAKVGEARFVRLGNARFMRADVNGGIGEIEVDFTGDLLDESRAKVDLDIGEASILLPRDIGIKMSIGGGLSFLSQKDVDGSFYKRGRSYYSEDYEDERKKFFIRVTPGLGELSVDRE